MRTIVTAAGVLLALSCPALAADDPIAVRQALMWGNGAAAGVAGPMMKGEMEYNAAAARAVIFTINGAAQALGDFFPEGSFDPERSRAAEAIWQDTEGFQAAVEEFRSATAAAVEAAGEDGPADGQAFAAAMGPVFGACSSCHEDYRISD
jgi:cytochrome c556